MNSSKKLLILLEALGTYSMLTYKHMITLGVFKDNGNASRFCKMHRERRRPLISILPTTKFQEVIYYLTSKGKDFLIHNISINEENIHYFPKTIVHRTQDINHRMSLIDLQLSLFRYCKQNELRIDFCDRYFDKVGSNTLSITHKSKTAILTQGKISLKTDMIFSIFLPNKERELYLVELERGYNAKKSVKAFYNYASVILSESVNTKYSYHKAFRILFILDHKTMRDTVRKRVNNNPKMKHLTEHFLLNTTLQVSENFFSGWVNLNGQDRKLYYA